jgi:hypothetical protein
LIRSVSFDGMNVQAVIGILGLVAAAFSTLWATGGWSALRRRSIQQELDLAKDLPSSAAKDRLTTHVEEEIDIYLYRLHTQTPNVQRPLSLFLLGLVITAVIASIFPSQDVNIFVIVGVEGILLALAVWAYAMFMRSWWIKRSRKHRAHLLQEARRAGPTAGASKGQK